MKVHHNNNKISELNLHYLSILGLHIKSSMISLDTFDDDIKIVQWINHKKLEKQKMNNNNT